MYETVTQSVISIIRHCAPYMRDRLCFVRTARGKVLFTSHCKQ